MSSNVRVRFAPSPTGPLHIGGVRTALFNYLFAKKHQGSFVLRIEDTDQARYVEGAEKYIINSLAWLGLRFDESPESGGDFGPYRQSERKELYRKYADQLIDEGKAYYAFDTPEELADARKTAESDGKTFIYNWENRLQQTNSLSLSEDDVTRRLANNDPYVIRFKTPLTEHLALKDEIRGDITINTHLLDDKVLFKSDGMPTYHLANIVDDHLMEITHVIRGEEWLPSLALHQQLYDAFGWTAPSFAHLPLILKPTGKGKLSKRDGDKLGFPVFPLAWENPENGEIARGYKEDGYFPEAVINFLAFLGWNPGTAQEIFSLEELIGAFDLTKVNKAGARFDPEKTKWFNHHYMHVQPSLELALSFKETHEQLKDIDENYIAMVVDLIKERAAFVSEFWGLSHFFFQAPRSYDEKAMKKSIKEGTKEILDTLVSLVEGVEDFNVENLQSIIKGWITEQGIGFGKVMMPLRLALVGSLQGPDVFKILFMIGKNESQKRIIGLSNSI